MGARLGEAGGAEADPIRLVVGKVDNFGQSCQSDSGVPLVPGQKVVSWSPTGTSPDPRRPHLVLLMPVTCFTKHAHFTSHLPEISCRLMMLQTKLRSDATCGIARLSMFFVASTGLVPVLVRSILPPLRLP